MARRIPPQHGPVKSISVPGVKDDSGAFTIQEPPQTPTQKLSNLGAAFPEQHAFTEDKAKFVDAQCGRRSGKSTGLAIRFFKTLAKYPKSQCVYLALTLDSARDILWPVLQELNDKYHLNHSFQESKLTMTAPNGAQLKLYGADMKNFIKRLKGRKFPGVGIDEAQDFGSHLRSLVDDVLTPAIADYADGWLAITGTPGPVPQGYFFEVTQNRKYGYSHHQWTMLENPYMPDPAAFIADIKLRHEWEDDNPTLLREYRNKWVLDPSSLWIQYSEKKCHYTELPTNTPKNPMQYVLGIDIGFKDADALAVIGWSYDSPVTYLIEEQITAKQGLTELVEQIQALQKRYNFVKMIIDEGGLGKKLAEEMRRRHAIPVEGADKTRKQENVELLNDSMRLGKFKAKSDSRFALDSYLVQIDWDRSTSNRIVIKKDPHSDIIDAVLYAFKFSPAYAFKAPTAEPKIGSREWSQKIQDEMYEKELAYLQEQAQNDRIYGEYE